MIWGFSGNKSFLRTVTSIPITSAFWNTLAGVCVCVFVCVGTSPVGPRVSVKLHLHVIEIVEDCRALLHPASGGSQRRACRCGAVNVPVSSFCHAAAPGLSVAAAGSH